MKCLRCGKCCYFLKDGKSHKCKYLVRLSKKKTACRIYFVWNRIGLPIHEGIYCKSRKEQGTIIKGCPFNK